MLGWEVVVLGWEMVVLGWEVVVVGPVVPPPRKGRGRQSEQASPGSELTKPWTLSREHSASCLTPA